MILDLFRQGEAIAPTDVEKRIFRTTMQDEARHVAYGTMRIRHAVNSDPDVADEIHEALDHCEDTMVQLGIAPDISTALAMLPAGSEDKIEEVGYPLQMQLSKNQFTSYLALCERGGISRLDRTKLPLHDLGIDVEQLRTKVGRR